DARDDDQLAEPAARDRRLDHEDEQQHGHEDADRDLERESLIQEEGGSGSPAPRFAGFPRMRRSAHPIGSYVLVTMRSLSGMIALSVMWMCSGQTSVQHFVMLQNPRPCFWRMSSMRSFVSSGCISRAASRTKKRGPAKDFLFSSWS